MRTCDDCFLALTLDLADIDGKTLESISENPLTINEDEKYHQLCSGGLGGDIVRSVVISSAHEEVSDREKRRRIAAALAAEERERRVGEILRCRLEEERALVTSTSNAVEVAEKERKRRVEMLSSPAYVPFSTCQTMLHPNARKYVIQAAEDERARRLSLRLSSPLQTSRPDYFAEFENVVGLEEDERAERMKWAISAAKESCE